ncbi:major royal jelly protein 1-like isoform X1 [Neodiprion fabricii]|uniref:major royal jelly protein 1-like isoform X1 n=2 Tax=Neodiprion fabricii TaxID=2872261 RepID=UPI001ED938F2|nr:major royal jelly protein 1-like isoform X1 [Neodiprion fabricii]
MEQTPLKLYIDRRKVCSSETSKTSDEAGTPLFIMTLQFSRIWRILPIFLACVAWSSAAADLETIYEWKYIDYVWESDAEKEAAVANGTYDYTNIVVVDVQSLPDDRVIVTTPRYKNNPATLSVISSQSADNGPLLQPYPSWSWNNADDCSGFTSVNRVYLDQCNRLWLVDSGKIGNEQVCSAKIFGFDPSTDEMLYNMTIPDNISHNPTNTSQGRLELQVVETTGDNCENTWLYISDLEGYGLLISNLTATWRLQDKIFEPDYSDASATNFTSCDDSVDMYLGPSGLLIFPPGFVEDGNYLIFKPMSKIKSYTVNVDELHNSWNGSELSFYLSAYTPPSQEPAKTYTKEGLLFANFISANAIGCWHLEHPLADANVAELTQDDERLQFVFSLKMKHFTNGTQELWVMSNRLQKFILGTVDFTDVNIRIMTVEPYAYVEGTVCEPESYEVVDTIYEKNYTLYEQSACLYTPS